MFEQQTRIYFVAARVSPRATIDFHRRMYTVRCGDRSLHVIATLSNEDLGGAGGGWQVLVDRDLGGSLGRTWHHMTRRQHFGVRVFFVSLARPTRDLIPVPVGGRSQVPSIFPPRSFLGSFLGSSPPTERLKTHQSGAAHGTARSSVERHVVLAEAGG